MSEVIFLKKRFLISFDFWPLILAGNKFTSVAKETRLFKSNFQKFVSSITWDDRQYLLLIRDTWRQNYNHFFCYCHYSYLKKRNWIYFRESFFLTFHVDLILRIGYQWIFHEDLYSRILVEFPDLTNVF